VKRNQQKTFCERTESLYNTKMVQVLPRVFTKKLTQVLSYWYS